MPHPLHDPRRLLIVQPSWVGDAVMATPTLRAIRRSFPDSHITYLMRRYVRPIYAGMPWWDSLMTYRTNPGARSGVNGGVCSLTHRVRAGAFDLAILLPNSFRLALVCRLAGIDRIVGYARDFRGPLLTDRLRPIREGWRFTPSPIVKSYLKLAAHLGADVSDESMQLFVTKKEKLEAIDVLRRAGLEESIDKPGEQGRSPLIVLNVGAQFGASKLWKAEYFAAVCDRLIDTRGATVIVSSAPRERQIVDEIAKHTKRPFIDLASFKPSLGALKEIVRRCDLMITNDTGPRHIAAAMGTSVVTIFGPTHQAWTTIDFAREIALQIPVECGPCQLKVCPIDHRCMTLLKPELVIDASNRLLDHRVPLRVI